MKAIDYFISYWKKFFDFSGRARRTEVWSVVLVNFLIAVGFAFITFFLRLFVVLDFIYGIACVVPTITMTVRRLHDAGLPGGWVIPTLIPAVGVIATIIIYCLPGQNGENAYGIDPRTIYEV